MSRELEHVNRAVRILVSRNAKLNQRLYEAASEFQIALREPDQWPTGLLAQAVQIDRKLTAKGNAARTINGMDVRDAQQIAEAILDLSRAIDATEAGPRRATTPIPHRLDAAGQRWRPTRPVSMHH